MTCGTDHSVSILIIAEPLFLIICSLQQFGVNFCYNRDILLFGIRKIVLTRISTVPNDTLKIR